MLGTQLRLFNDAYEPILYNAQETISQAYHKLIKPRKISDCRLGLPYQGSKRQYSARILQAIADNAPECDYFVDLFGGGASISLQALSNGYNVFYNELDRNISTFFAFLINQISNKDKHSEFGFLPSEYYEFVAREKFFEIRDNKPCDIDSLAYREFVLITYSFGNDRNTYAFSDNKAKFKEAGHRWVMFNDMQGANVFKEYFAKDNFPQVIDDLAKKWQTMPLNAWQDKRYEFSQIILKLEFIRTVNEYKQGFRDFYKPTLDCIKNTKAKTMIDKCNEFAPDIPKKQYEAQRQNKELVEIKQLEQLEQLQQLERLQQLEQLQRLERLQQLQQLANTTLDFGKLNISNASYDMADFSKYPKDKTIIYCDPPYKNTTQKYRHSGLDYDKFYNDLREWHQQGYRIFISEYDMPSDFECILEINTRDKLSSNIQGKRTEKLFMLRD